MRKLRLFLCVVLSVSVLGSCLIGFAEESVDVTADTNAEEVSDSAEEDTSVLTGDFLNELDKILRDKHIGNFDSEMNMHTYLDSVGVFENVSDLPSDNQPISYSTAVVLVMNSISENKEKIVNMGEYPINYRIAYKSIWEESEEIRLSKGELNAKYKDILLNTVRRYAVDTKWEKASSTLIEKGILVGKEGGNIALDEAITRAEFITLIARTMVCFGNVFIDEKPKFSDVDEGHWASKDIGALQNVQVINGYEDGSFRPENNILKIEMWKSSICARGLNAHFEEKPYPERYEALITFYDLYRGMGNKIELFENKEKPATRGECVQMIYNLWFDEDNLMIPR